MAVSYVVGAGSRLKIVFEKHSNWITNHEWITNHKSHKSQITNHVYRKQFRVLLTTI